MTDAEKRRIEYIIGIDLGHGETSAAMCSAQWDTAVELLEPAKDLDMGGNKKVMPSAITILSNGNAYIGDAAFNPEILKQAEVKVCFKQAPKDINGEPERIMIRFMQEVYKRIREKNKAKLTEDNHVVYIATPSGWDKNTQKLYVEMARSAGLPIAGVTKESRAAFVRAQHDVTSGLGRNIEKGAIVFDMGSSTLDFTYMDKNLKMIDYGYNCGASFIEKSIYLKLEEENNAVKLFKKKFPKLCDYLVFEARKVKEQVYFDPSLKVKKTINFDDFIDDEELEDERVKISFNPGELNKFIAQNGYIKSIEDAMIDYKNNHIAGQKIYGVFLTGGASRMDFIIPLVCQCWDVKSSQVYRDQDPSLTISQGVAELARLDLRTKDMVDGLEYKIDQLFTNTLIYDTFIQEFGHDLLYKVTDEMDNVITSWRDDGIDQSLNDLQEDISSAVEDCVSEFSSYAPQYAEKAIQDATKEIRQKVEHIVAVYRYQGINIELSQNITLSQFSLSSGIGLDDVLSDISEKLKEDSFNWGAAIGGAAIGGVIGMLMGGPLAWLIGLGWLASKMFGEEKTEAQKQAEAMNKDLDSDQRQEVFDSLSEKREDITNAVANSIYQSLISDRSICVSINTVSKEYLQAYKDSLKSARILID